MSSTGKRRSKSKQQQAKALRVRDALIEQHIEWARDIAAKVASRLPTWFHADDLIGPASLALLDAAAKYDKARGVPFRAFARLSVEGACYSAARRNEYRERAHAELKDDAADDAPPTTQLSGGVRRGVGGLPAAVWDLPPEQFRIVNLVYGHDMTVEAAAARMRISSSKASQYHRAAIATLRERLMRKP